MGLDKKPTPPQKRVKEELPTFKSPIAKEATDVDEDIETQSNAELDTPQEMDTEPNRETTGQKKTKDDYEEDFEADDEGPVEDGDEAEENLASAATGEEKETETRDENYINEEKSNSDSDDTSMSKVKRSSSVSSGRTSSLSSSDNDNSEREIVDTKEISTADVPEESLHAEEVLTTAENQPEETEATESSDVTLPRAAVEDSGTQDSPGDGMEKSDLEMSEDTDKKEGTEDEQSGEHAKPEDKPQENQPERAKSMQEKLAEAILKQSQCSSEPEFSDTSTEEDEGASVKTLKDGQVAQMADITLPQRSKTQDDIPDESGANSQEAACEERVHVEMGQLTEETNTQEPHFHTEEEQEIDETKEGAESLDMEEKQVEEHSESTNEVEQPDKREEVITEMEETQEKVTDDDNSIAEVQDSLVQKTETHAETLDTEIPEMEGGGSASKTENGTETGGGDTERQRDTDDADQNIERRSDGQTDRDEREDLVDEAGDDRSTGEMVQETDGKVDVGGSVGKVEEGDKSSEDKAEEEATEKLEVEDRIESLGTEEAMKPGEEETQDSEEENKGGHDLNAEDENEDSTEKGKDGVSDKHNEGEAEELSSEAGIRQNDSECGQDVRTQGHEIENDGLNDEQNKTEDGEQIINKLTVEAEEEGQEKPNSEEGIEWETKKVKDETMEDGVQKEEEEAKVEDKKIDEMVEGTDENCVENELETGDKLVEEPEKEVTDMNKISENTLDTGNGKEEAVSDENTAQELEFNFEVQNEESVSREEQNEIGSRGASNDDIEASAKEEVDEPTGVNNDLLDANIDTEKGERQDDSLEEAEKVEEYLQEELQDKSESETTGDRVQDVLDDNEMPETDKNMKEIEKDVDQEQEIENKSDTELVRSERESKLSNEHEDQTSDNQKADKQDDQEKADKELETPATTLIENVTSQITQEMVNKDTQNDIVSADATAQEPSESELKGTDTELRSRDASKVMDPDPVEPQEKKGNSENNDGGSSVSHSLKSQPVDKVKKGVKGPVLSIDSEDLANHSTALTKAVGVDLVSNWINIHQESRYFQTFIEPLDEEGLIVEETEERLNGTDIESLDETLKSRDETATPVRKILNEKAESVVESLKTETKVEAIETDAHSDFSKDSVHTSTKDEIVQEAGDTRGSLVTTWSRQRYDEHTNQKDTSGQETSMKDEAINLETSATSEDNQEQTPSESEQKDVSTDVDLNAKESERSNQQEMTDETTHLFQTEEASNKETLESSEYIEPQSPTLTVITDLTIINKSENRIQDDTASVDFHSGQSDGSRNVDGNRKTKVIDGHLTQTLTSRDTLSTFSLDDSRLFGPTGYPILTTAHTKNSY